MEQFNFIGKNLTKERLDNAENKILDDIVLGQEPLFEELEKTEFEKKMILLGEVTIKNEFERLGLAYKHFVPEQHVRVLSEEMADQVLAEDSSAAFDPHEQQILIVRREKQSKIQLFHDLLHEMIHSVSKIKYEISEDDSISNYRVGYALKNKKENKKYLEAFNEAITEDLTQDLLYKNKEHLFEEFDIKNFSQSPGAYSKEIELVDKIIENVSKINNQPEHLIRDKFYKGLFTGEMMHLRDVEKCFGESSLRVLGLLDTDKTGSLFPLYMQYFSVDTSEGERSRIQEKIIDQINKNS